MDAITIPDAYLLFNATFVRAGFDLKLVGENGQTLVIDDYFRAETRAALLSPEGARLTPDVVEALAGPLAPGQYAQATAPQADQPAIGRVEAVTGGATVVRNGVAVALNAGDVVRKGDVVQTAANSAVAIVFSDGSAFSLTANARMVLNDFVFQEGGSNNSAFISLVQGSISFVAGQVAKTGDMRVDTPVATMGIRGTAVLVEITANNGPAKFSVMVEPNGATGSFTLRQINQDGTPGALIGTVNNSSIGWVVTPAGPLQVIAQQVQKTQAELAQELVIVQQVFQIFNQGQQNPFVPDQQQQDPNRRGDNPNDPNPQTAQNSSGSSTLANFGANLNIPDGTGNPTTTLVNVLVTLLNNQTDDNTTDDGTDDTDDTDDTLTPFNTPPVPNVITGTQDDDTIEGTAENDIVFALGGNDTIIAGHGGGDDIYDGGGDNDTVKFESTTQGVFVDLELGVARGIEIGADFLIDIENVVGGSGDDTIIGTSGVNVLKGGDGNDIIDGNGGADTLIGGDGNDVFLVRDDAAWAIDGGDGVDTIRFVGNLSIVDDNGPDIPTPKSIEIIDLNTDGANIVDIDAETIADFNDQHTIRVLGGPDDVINVENGFDGHPDGYWIVAATGVSYPDDNLTPGIVFNRYEFVDGQETLATAYVQDGVTIKTGDAFLQSNYVEVGVSSSGSLGTAGPAPEGFHPQGFANLSFVFDANGFDQAPAPVIGDVTLPGTPEDSIVIGYNGFSFANDERLNIVNFFSETSDTSPQDAPHSQSTTIGQIDGLTFTQVINLDPNATYFTTTVTLKNDGGETLDDVRFMRSFDPDQDVVLHYDHDTANDVLSNPGEGSNVAAVQALGTYSNVAVNLVAFDADARASAFGFTNHNAYDTAAYDDPADPDGDVDDVAIAMTFDFGDLAPGESVTRTFYTSFNTHDEDDNPVGTSGNDLLIGSNDENTIDGGQGDDILVGLEEADSFVFTANFGHDTIVDFTPGVDSICIASSIFADFDTLHGSAVEVNGGTVITADPDNSITLKNVALASLQASDFHFV